MHNFLWNPAWETGSTNIDDQHRELFRRMGLPHSCEKQVIINLQVHCRNQEEYGGGVVARVKPLPLAVGVEAEALR